MSVSARSVNRYAMARSSGEAWIVAMGSATGLLYLIANWATHAIHSNGAWLGVSAVADSRATTMNAVWLNLGIYLVATGLLFAVYLGVLSMCRRGALEGAAGRWALLIPCLLNVMLLGCTPVLSQDVFSYMAHGYLGAVPGSNPLLRPADWAARTSIGPFLAAYGWHGQVGVTPYGIVWTRIEVTIMQLCGLHVGTALVLLKSVIVAASLGTGLCIWIFLGRVRPTAQFYGTLAYLWNPLILAEFAGDGHNDALMVFFVVASLAACAAQRRTTSLVMQLLGVLTKYVSLLLLPAHLMYLWHTRRSVGGLATRIILALLVTLGIASLSYGSLWVGAHSFDGLLMRGQPVSSASLCGAINWMLRRSPLAPHAGPVTVAAVTLPLLAFIGWASLRVADASSLSRTMAWIAVAYVLVSSPDFWPWYACMPVTLLLVADAEGWGWFAVVLSLAARLCAPLDLLREQGFLSMVAARGMLTGVGSTLPLIMLGIWGIRRFVTAPAAQR